MSEQLRIADEKLIELDRNCSPARRPRLRAAGAASPSARKPATQPDTVWRVTP